MATQNRNKHTERTNKISITKTMKHLETLKSKLSNKVINEVLCEVAEFNAGKKFLHSFADSINGEEHLTLRELFEELNIEVLEEEEQPKVGHTGGDWQASIDHSKQAGVYPKTLISTVDKSGLNGKMIAICYNKNWTGISKAEAEANAKLIAVSPLLLEALQNLSDYVMQSTDAIPPQLVNALTVIKKATN